MEQLLNALPGLLRAAGNTEAVTETAAIAVWKHVAGAGLSMQTIAVSLQGHKLTVAVADLVWQQQLETLSPQMLYRLNSVLGQGTIKFIEFRIDPQMLQTRRQEEAKNQLVVNEPMAPTPIPFELVSAAATIHDPSLRRAFLGAASNCLNRRETKQE